MTGSRPITGNRAPAVSVIIPTFNRASVLDRAVASVLGQTFTDFELIVVDDGSTDETDRVLARSGARLRVHRQGNQGVSAARNAGIRMARGKWIAFLDSDDCWLPEKLERQIAFFRDHPDAGICQTEEIWIRNGRRVNPKRRHRKPSGWIFIDALNLCLVSPSAVMIDRALIDAAGGFDETFPACEDYDLWLRIALHHPIHLIDEPLTVKYGGHPDQLSRMPALDQYRIRAIARILSTEPLDPAQEAAARSVLMEKCAIYAAGCRKRGRIAEAEACEALSAKAAPGGEAGTASPTPPSR